MRASEKSLHAWLYKFTYTHWIWKGLPQNLCPYFWKLVWAVIAFIPNFILQFPYLVAGIVSEEARNERHPDDRRMRGFIMWFVGTVLCFYLYANFHWFKAMFGFDDYYHNVANVGWIVNAVIVFVVSVFIIATKYSEWKDNQEPEEAEPKQPSIILEFIKAKYNRYCPKIDWEQK